MSSKPVTVRLHHAKSTENSRAILGLTAAGYNAANMAGVDLTAGLTDMAYLRAQGTNGPIWALIALDCHGYDIPSAPMARSRPPARDWWRRFSPISAATAAWL